MSAADDDEVDDASLRSMRAVWLSMRDEEPPTAGMSALLAAAATKAEEMRAKPAWWERVVHSLRRPPALAFATVMVLIGGAVLVTRTSEDKQPDSMVATAPEPPASVPPPTSPPTSAPTDHPALAPAEEALASPQQPPVAPPKVQKNVKRAPGKQRPQTYKEEAAALEEKPKGAEPVADKAAGDGELESPGIDRGSRAPVTATRPSADDLVLSDRAAPATPPTVQLLRQAESAASRGDCAAVKTIATKIRQQDDAFYKERVLKHAAIAKCL